MSNQHLDMYSCNPTYKMSGKTANKHKQTRISANRLKTKKTIIYILLQCSKRTWYRENAV